jgi:hypothetical protein
MKQTKLFGALRATKVVALCAGVLAGCDVGVKSTQTVPPKPAPDAATQAKPASPAPTAAPESKPAEAGKPAADGDKPAGDKKAGEKTCGGEMKCAPGQCGGAKK